MYRKIFQRTIIIGLCIITLTRSVVTLDEPAQAVRVYTRNIEFDYAAWIFNALGVKAGQLAMDAPRYMTEQQQHDTVIQYLDLLRQSMDLKNQIQVVLADPNQDNPQAAAAPVQETLDGVQSQLDTLAPLAETILQQQISAVVSDIGLSLEGQPVPPILYHATPLPMALIISPRDVIRQDANISLEADISVTDISALETQIESNEDVSALVVPIGGVGVYPTMVIESTDLTWLVQTISHEWVHNYLTMRPLGINYDTTPELRTMNETTASIAGDEIGSAVIARFYPELAPPPAPAATPQPESTPAADPIPTPQPPAFDFNTEMHTTRVHVDELLAAGQIEEAEAYMETRRQVFWEQGYLIRRLNQAYFAFYGAYADSPGGAAGEDPVGPAVRALRANSPSLADFINRIAWMNSFSDLQNIVDTTP